MVQKINETLMDVGRLREVKGVAIHNDAGGMTIGEYLNWLKNRNKTWE